MSWQQRTSEQLDRMENKLDNHLGRISKLEEAVVWLKGHVKIVTTLVITAIGTLIAAYAKGGL